VFAPRSFRPAAIGGLVMACISLFGCSAPSLGGRVSSVMTAAVPNVSDLRLHAPAKTERPPLTVRWASTDYSIKEPQGAAVALRVIVGNTTQLVPESTTISWEPAFARAFDFLLSLYRDGLAPPTSNNTIANLYQEFARGTFAMYITGPWNLGEFRRRLPPELQDSWGTAPLPGPTGPASGVSLAGGASLSIFRASKHRALALQLVEFLSRPEQQARFYRLTGDLPARREAWRDSALAADREAEAFRIQLTRTVPTPMIPEWEQVTTKIMDRTEAAARGAQIPAASLAALDADVDRLLERRRYLLARRHPAAGVLGRRVP